MINPLYACCKGELIKLEKERGISSIYASRLDAYYYQTIRRSTGTPDVFMIFPSKKRFRISKIGCNMDACGEIVPGTTYYFNTLEEAMMYATMQD